MPKLSKVKLPDVSTGNIQDYGMVLGIDYYYNGRNKQISTMVIHKKYVDSNGNFKMKNAQ